MYVYIYIEREIGNTVYIVKSHRLPLISAVSLHRLPPAPSSPQPPAALPWNQRKPT